MSLLGQIVAGESSTPAGQQAVLNVMMNRAAVNYGGYGTSLISQATAPLQFSAYPGQLGQPSLNTETMVSAANAGTLGNIVPNSLNYANPSIMNQAATPNSWVWTAQASGQGVQIGGNTFWANSSGGSPGYDPSQLYNGSGSTIATGPADAASGDGFGGVLSSAGPADPYAGDYTSVYPDPNTAFDTSGASTSSATGAVTPGASATTTTSPSTSSAGSASGDVGQGTPVTQGLQQGTIAAVGGWISNIESAFGSGLKSAITAAESAVATWFGSITNWAVRFFLIVVGIVIVFAALIALMWDHGGKETVVNMGRAAAA